MNLNVVHLVHVVRIHLVPIAHTNEQLHIFKIINA